MRTFMIAALALIGLAHAQDPQGPLCSLMRKEMVAKEADDIFLPECNDDGTFASRQCFGEDCYCCDPLTGELSTDLTACSENDGQEHSEGSEQGSGENEDVTDDNDQDTEHHEHHRDHHGHKDPEDHEHLDRGHEDGYHHHEHGEHHGHENAMQPTYVEGVEGTAEAVMSACFEDYQDAVDAGLLGNFIPQCMEDGSYAPMQCHGSTGECWCVDTLTGDQEDVDLAECQVCTLMHKAMVAQEVDDDFLPDCNDDGTFASRQCFKGDCYCADALTGELSADLTACPLEEQAAEDNEEATETTDANVETTEDTEEATTAAEQKENAQDSDDSEQGSESAQAQEPMCSLMLKQMVAQEVDDDFLPDCNDDGTFASRQCFKGDCYCADALTGELSTDLTACPDVQATEGTGETTEDNEDNEDNEDATEANLTTEDNEKVAEAEVQVINDDIVTDSDEDEGESEGSFFMGPQGLIAILLGITMIAISGFVITKRRSQAPDASANNKSFIYDTSAFDDSQTAPLNREAQLEELTVAQ